MLEYTLENGLPVPPSLVRHVACADPTATATLQDDMVYAHIELAKLIRPATPDGVFTIKHERKTGWWRFLGPVKLVRFLMGVTIVALLVFLGLVIQAEAPQELNDTNTTSSAVVLAEDRGDVAYLVAYLLSAAVLGAAFAQLYRIKRYIGNYTYDHRLDFSYTANVVLGAVAGVVLAILVPLEDLGGAQAGLTKPLLALLGGFSARAVYRILSRIVDSVETLVSGDPREDIAAAEQAIETRAASEINEINQMINQKLAKVASGVNAVDQAIDAGQTELAKDHLASLQATCLQAPGQPRDDPGNPPRAVITNAKPSDGADDSRSADELADTDASEP